MAAGAESQLCFIRLCAVRSLVVGGTATVGIADFGIDAGIGIVSGQAFFRAGWTIVDAFSGRTHGSCTTLFLAAAAVIKIRGEVIAFAIAFGLSRRTIDNAFAFCADIAFVTGMATAATVSGVNLGVNALILAFLIASLAGEGAGS